MRIEILNWWKQAQKDLGATKDGSNSGNYEWASFQAHQATEKALKALYIKKYKKLMTS